MEDLKEIKSKNEYYDKISKKNFPIYFQDKTVDGYYYLCYLSEKDERKVWIYESLVILEKNSGYNYSDLINNMKKYKKITELEFLEKLNLAKSLI